MARIAFINPKNVPEEEYANYEISEAVRVVCLRDDGMLPLIYLSSVGGYMLPGGGADEGEDALAAATRELKEETGCIGRDFVHEGFIEEVREFNKTIRKSHVFRCMLDSQGEPNFTDEEIEEGSEVVWKTIPDALFCIGESDDLSRPSGYVKLRERVILEYIMHSQSQKH